MKTKKETIQENIDSGYKKYFSGKTIQKKYQQKIARLAEEITKNEDRYSDRDSLNIDATDLNIYLKDKAYNHIKENGYPKNGDVNYLDASGVVYTYFSTLFEQSIPRGKRLSQAKKETKLLSKLEIDIQHAKQAVYEAKEIEELKGSIKNLNKLSVIEHDIKSPSHGNRDDRMKLDNLSFIAQYSRLIDYESSNLYPETREKDDVLWNNLIEISKSDKEAKEYVVTFLNAHRIEDFRITHNEPYIKRNNYSCFSVSADNKSIDKKIDKFALDYIVNKDLVLETYNYIEKCSDSYVRKTIMSSFSI